MDTEELLRASAPTVGFTDEGGTHALRLLNAAKRRRSRAWLWGASLGVVLLAGGTTAASATGLFDWSGYDTVTENGPCTQAWTFVMPNGVTDDAYLADARHILATIDFASLDLTADLAYVKNQYEVEGVYSTPYDADTGKPIPSATPQREHPSDADYRSYALDRAVIRELDRRLDADGFEKRRTEDGYVLEGAAQCASELEDAR